MKLYTEEQVRKAIKLAQKCESDCGGVYFDYGNSDEIMQELTPIELPSYEDIEIKGDEFSNRTSYSECFKEGAEWVIEQIKKQDNG